MKVLLTQNVPNLGQAGETKNVADGYARNYLIPRGLATVATAGVIKSAAAEKQAVQRKQARAQAELNTLAERLKATELTFKAKVGDQHRLYGAITASDIAEQLSSQLGQTIDKRHVELDEPIRHLGSYKVPVRVGPKVIPTVNVTVEPE